MLYKLKHKPELSDYSNDLKIIKDLYIENSLQIDLSNVGSINIKDKLSIRDIEHNEKTNDCFLYIQSQELKEYSEYNDIIFTPTILNTIGELPKLQNVTVSEIIPKRTVKVTVRYSEKFPLEETIDEVVVSKIPKKLNDICKLVVDGYCTEIYIRELQYSQGIELRVGIDETHAVSIEKYLYVSEFGKRFKPKLLMSHYYKKEDGWYKT